MSADGSRRHTDNNSFSIYSLSFSLGLFLPLLLFHFEKWTRLITAINPIQIHRETNLGYVREMEAAHDMISHKSVSSRKRKNENAQQSRFFSRFICSRRTDSTSRPDLFDVYFSENDSMLREMRVNAWECTWKIGDNDEREWARARSSLQIRLASFLFVVRRLFLMYARVWFSVFISFSLARNSVSIFHSDF